MNCELRAYGRPIWRIPKKHDLTRLQQFLYSSSIQTLKFSAIIENSTSKIFSKGHVIVYSRGECPVFERLVFKTDKIECVF